MAVEIPVVIDIEGAFQEAAKRVPKAMSPLQKAINGLNEDLSVFRELLGEVPINSKDFQLIAKEIQAISQALEVADDLFKKFSTNKGSINQLSDALASVERRWAEMGAQQKFNANGGLSDDAKKLKAEYERITAELQKQGKTLSQMAQEERNAATEAKRRADSEAKERERISAANKMKIQQRRDENAILQMEGKTIQVLQQQQRILTERIAKTRIGTEEYKRMQQRLAEINLELQKATGNVNAMTNGMQRQSRVLQSLTSMASMYVSVFGAIRLVKQIRDVTGELEFQRISLGRLLQDVSKGNTLFEQIKEAAIESPFRIKDLVTYTKQLAAYRIEQEELFTTTKRLADISAGLGVDMNRLILAYGQVRAASVLRGQELRQFTEAGIPLVELLAEKFTDLKGEMVSTADVFKLISDRAVPFSYIADIFEDLTEKGGMFYKMQEEQAKTLKGRWEKLKDAYDIALQSVGDTETFQRQNDIVIGALRLIADNLRIIVKVADAAVISWAAYNAVMLLVGKSTKAVATAEQEAAIAESIRSKKISGLFAKINAQAWAERQLANATRQATLGTNMLTRALGKLRIALLTNPWAIAGAAILGVVLALSRYKEATDDAAEATNTLNRAVDDMRAANKRNDRIGKLIDKYEELSKVEERNAAQNETLERTTKKLSDEFPGLSERIRDNNLSLKERLQLVTDLNSEEAKRLEDEKKKNEAKLEAGETKLFYDEQEKAVADQAEADATAYYNAISSQLKDLEKQGKGGRSWFAKFMFGGNEYDELYSQLVLARQVLDKAEEDAGKASENVNGLKNAIKDLKEELYGYQSDESEISKEWEEWQRQINNIQKERLKAGEAPLFSPEDITGLKSVYDLSSKLEKKTKELTVSIAAMKALYKSMGESDAKESLGKTIAKEEKWLEIANAIKTALDLSWKTSKKGSDTRLSDLKKNISEITNAYKKFVELRKYMSEDAAMREMGDLFPQIKYSPSYANTLAELIKLQSDVNEKLRRSPKDKTLLEMQRTINTEISNLKFDELKRKLDAEFKKVSDELKRSESARNFYDNILGLTGDQDLAANLSVSVYGDIGEEFRDRIQKEMDAALAALKADGRLTAALDKAFKSMDYDAILAVEDLPDNVRDTVKKLQESEHKYNEGVAKDYAKLLLKYDEMEQQRVNLTSQANEEIRKLEEGLAIELKGIAENGGNAAAKAAAEARVKAAKDAVVRERDLGLSRLERDYRMFFSSVGVISEESARRVAQNQKKMLTEQFEKGEISLAKYKRELNEVNEQMKKYTESQGMLRSYLSGGIEGITKKFGEYADGLRAISHNIQVSGGKSGILAMDDETMEYIDKVGMIMGGDAFGVSGVSGRKNVAQQLVTAIASMSANAEEFKKNLQAAMDYAADGADSFAASFSQGLSTAGFWVTNVSTLIKELDAFNQDSMKTPKWLDVLASTATWTLGVAGDEAWDRLANLNEYATSGFEKLSQGNIVGAIADNIRGLVDFWGPNIKKIDRQIKEQSDSLDALDYQYKRLETSIQKAFGSDYIADYNKQLDVLYAKQAAYEEQARLEESKDKKKDQSKIDEYNKSARDVSDQIADMLSQISEFFAGTDLTSAAKDFASAWIDAYKQFGSTTDAMKEKFQDMIQEMITNSLAAKVMQDMLDPIFKQIDTLAQEGGELSAQDIAAISAAANALIPNINAAMTTLMSTLGSSGYDIRRQAGQFTGISRSVAGASEESITGLAAGIATQNMYMSYVPIISANVAAIVTYLTGDATQTSGATPITPTNSELMMSHLDSIDSKLANILDRFESVLTQNSGSNINRRSIAVRMI